MYVSSQALHPYTINITNKNLKMKAQDVNRGLELILAFLFFIVRWNHRRVLLGSHLHLDIF